MRQPTADSPTAGEESTAEGAEVSRLPLSKTEAYTAQREPRKAGASISEPSRQLLHQPSGKIGVAIFHLGDLGDLGG
jgi:hypothetical protein